ncbi:MAG: hypothetical protein ACI9HE_000336 [Planctomycetota bacterium]|jgi:hypothetical protein
MSKGLLTRPTLLNRHAHQGQSGFRMTANTLNLDSMGC